MTPARVGTIFAVLNVTVGCGSGSFPKTASSAASTSAIRRFGRRHVRVTRRRFFQVAPTSADGSYSDRDDQADRPHEPHAPNRQELVREQPDPDG